MLKKNLRKNQEIVYISMNYLYEKSKTKIEYVKKTLTIPRDLDILGKNKNINFSQVLQEALKKELGILRVESEFERDESLEFPKQKT